MKIKFIGHKKCSYYMNLTVPGSLARELPKAEGVAFQYAVGCSLLQSSLFHPLAGAIIDRSPATLRLRCGLWQLPQSRACGASQHAADAVAAAREPFIGTAGLTGKEKNPQAEG